LAWLDREGYGNRWFQQRHTSGFEETLAAAQESAGELGKVADGCGVAADELLKFFRLFADNERVVTAFSQGVNQSSAGSDKASAIINCHLLTGRIGRTG